MHPRQAVGHQQRDALLQAVLVHIDAGHGQRID